MTELFIDGLPAIPSRTANFKLSIENFYFTKSTSYTLDVELPLDVPQNRDIFGNVSRIDVSKEAVKLPARLVVDNVTLLTGVAAVTSFTNKSVKVQLLGNASAYNYGNNEDGQYLDMMDLGDWYHATWPDGSYYDGSGWAYHDANDKIKQSAELYSRAQYMGPGYGAQKFTGLTLFDQYLSGELGWVAYPTYGENSEVRYNQVAYREVATTVDGVTTYDYYKYIRPYEGVEIYPSYTSNQLAYAFAVQPMMWKVAEVVAAGTGFTLDKEDNVLYQDSFLNRIFLVNCSTSAMVNECLPHWTVNEFWDQLEQAFGLVLSVDYVNKKLKLLRRKDFFATAPVIELQNIVSDFEATVDDSTETDIAVDNVGFADFGGAPEDLLDSQIKSSARIMDFDTIGDLVNWGVDHKSTLHYYKDVIFRLADGRRLIYTTDANQQGDEGFIEVDMFRPRITDADEADSPEPDVDIELKIVPARFVAQKCDILQQRAISGSLAWSMREESVVGSFDVTMLQVPGPASAMMYGSTMPGRGADDAIDIQAVIEGDEEATGASDDKGDLIYMAITNPLNWDMLGRLIEAEDHTIDRTFSYPRAWLRERCMAPLDSAIEMADTNKSLSLVPISGQDNLASATISGATAIHTEARHCIKFVADAVPDPGAIYLIRNRRFVCHKIEVSVKPHGLDRLMTGYFYELNS